jgi:(p)ppGpp synthase/HD superfamily hydrolase
MNELILKAKQFAIDAHASIGHQRKYTNEPYHVHLERVANLVATVTSDEEIIAAAWLHDVLEDVAPKNSIFNKDAIAQQFGERVLQLVIELTDVTTLADGNRAKRKAIERERLAKASSDGKIIKLADLIDNITDIAKHDPNFSRIFKKEAALDFPYLEVKNNRLYDQLHQLLF